VVWRVRETAKLPKPLDRIYRKPALRFPTLFFPDNFVALRPKKL